MVKVGVTCSIFVHDSPTFYMQMADFMMACKTSAYKTNIKLSIIKHVKLPDEKNSFYVVMIELQQDSLYVELENG